MDATDDEHPLTACLPALQVHVGTPSATPPHRLDVAPSNALLKSQTHAKGLASGSGQFFPHVLPPPLRTVSILTIEILASMQCKCRKKEGKKKKENMKAKRKKEKIRAGGGVFSVTPEGGDGQVVCRRVCWRFKSDILSFFIGFHWPGKVAVRGRDS